MAEVNTNKYNKHQLTSSATSESPTVILQGGFALSGEIPDDYRARLVLSLTQWFDGVYGRILEQGDHDGADAE